MGQKKKKSPNFSFIMWDSLKYLKGRRRALIALVGVVLGYFISNDNTIAILSGMIVEAFYAAVEFYIKEVSSDELFK